MNKLFGGDVGRPSYLLLLSAKRKVCLLARVGNHRPCLRLHCLCRGSYRDENARGSARVQGGALLERCRTVGIFRLRIFFRFAKANASLKMTELLVAEISADDLGIGYG
jgi:hypothetical protein